MALSATTLSSAITAAKLQNIPIANTSGFADKQLVKIDNEYCYQVGPPSVPSGVGTITVRMRGSESSAAAPHDVGATVVTSASPSDFPAMYAGALSPQPPSVDDLVTIGADTTLVAPVKNTTYLIAKGSACAIVLGQATAAQQGLTLNFISTTGFAHTVTYAAGFLGAVGVNTVATFAALAGASLSVEAGLAGDWCLIGNQSVTLST